MWRCAGDLVADDCAGVRGTARQIAYGLLGPGVTLLIAGWVASGRRADE